MLYELFAITSKTAKPELSKIIHHAASHILDNGGVIRHIQSMGLRKLPYRIVKPPGYHLEGYYWQIVFYSNNVVPNTLIKDLLKQDLILRAEVSKQATKVTGFK